MESGTGFKAVIGLIVFMVGSFVVLWLAIAFLTTQIGPHEFGVKQKKFGGGASYTIGYEGGRRYFVKPFAEELHVFDGTIQYENIVAGEDGSSGLVVPTTDGQKVISDVTIAWRVFKEPNLPSGTQITEETTGEALALEAVSVEEVSKTEITEDEADAIGYHGGPIELINTYGISPRGWQPIIRKMAEDACKRSLGQLETDDYYNSHLREQRTWVAKKMLNQGWEDENGVHHRGLHAAGIHVEDVLVRAYTYTEAIDQAIYSKVAEVQQRQLRQAQEILESTKAEVTKIQAEGQAGYEVRIAESEAEEQKIAAKADLYERTQQSNGDLEVERARTQSAKMKTDALETSGGDLYVAWELSDLPKKVKGGILMDFNPINVSAWLELIAAGHQQY